MHGSATTPTSQNLLALQNINTQLDTTQNHLATGLAVASATDDAVKYFQSQSLNARASDLTTRKDAISQGISSLTAATNGITGVISILQQMEGVVNGASTQTAAQRASAATRAISRCATTPRTRRRTRRATCARPTSTVSSR